MSADYETESFKVYAHTDRGFIHICWRDGPCLGDLSAEHLAELDEIRRAWLSVQRAEAGS